MGEEIKNFNTHDSHLILRALKEYRIVFSSCTG